jgi:hypothetical protein
VAIVERIGDERTDTITALLAEAGEAHGRYEATELQGVYDQDWPGWYAAYAVEHGLGDLLGHRVATDHLAAFLASSNVDLEQIEPELRESWATYTARRIASEL